MNDGDRRPDAARSAVEVRGLGEAHAAVEAARRRGSGVLLVTEPGACARLGPGYLLEMMRQAGLDHDAVRALIDCGADAGYAMLALRVGWRDIHMAGPGETARRVAEMTEAAGGRFHAVLPEASGRGDGPPVDRSPFGRPAAGPAVDRDPRSG